MNEQLSQSDQLRITALDYGWRTASQNPSRSEYTKEEVLTTARAYLGFLQGRAESDAKESNSP
jgi:hypothetical protein